jgi:hypothetical protein
VLFWSITPPEIELAVAARTVGWIGFGFKTPATNGTGMLGADALIGYNNGVQNVVEDFSINAQVTCSGTTGVCRLSTVAMRA